jgi:lysophospholipase L1-like esterase
MPLQDRSRQRRQALSAATARPAAMLLAPVLVRQGSRVRRQTVVLPEAAGDRSGLAGGGGSGAPLHLLVVGDSSAAGVGVAQQSEALASRLAVEIAGRRGRAVAWQLAARTGATASTTTRELLPALRGSYDLVVLVLGVNDTLRLRSRARWREQITLVVDALQPKLAPQAKVLLAGVPDLGAFPALPQPLRAVLGWHAQGLDGELRRLADRRSGVLHIPAAELSGAEFADDGFHPNTDTYARWAQHIADHVG